MGIKNALNNFIFGKEEDTVGYESDMDSEYEDFDITDGANDEHDNRVSSGVSVSSGTSIEMVVVKPEKLETVTQIADYLVDRKTILLNLEETNKETANRKYR